MSKPSKTFKVIPTDNFLSEAKNLLKKYPNIKDDFLAPADMLKCDPITGNDYIGRQCYKVGMQISDKKKGESGAARVIVNIEISDREVYVLSVYDKGNQSTISEKELNKLLAKKSLIN
ncbi:hypothetical protein SAMN05444410_106107 [Hydrobacter penzbergensis]|uniref:mRNA-degrading endonuclease RelE, toxin component of the RelBE toxin-antitoxin system n=1 Tax=Hydrobacter penzbergensis TaxID=1235997 RepID=A0A8X8LDI4_9BACT|nr:hypothetical protein [Hydrobacter penzbergensis]SDW84269.1 hypothetical protein SAMN05444410_106107 [Hydrobacter penzbergensis]